MRFMIFHVGTEWDMINGILPRKQNMSFAKKHCGTVSVPNIIPAEWMEMKTFDRTGLGDVHWMRVSRICVGRIHRKFPSFFKCYEPWLYLGFKRKIRMFPGFAELRSLSKAAKVKHSKKKNISRPSKMLK